jgi:hypothetical protein
MTPGVLVAVILCVTAFLMTLVITAALWTNGFNREISNAFQAHMIRKAIDRGDIKQVELDALTHPEQVVERAEWDE